ncbi:hypothetical protein J6590_080749 [Homalodisca vitripennis]|nr:hypothetical protein J6590_080749 [Homalodisca vitripennis]
MASGVSSSTPSVGRPYISSLARGVGEAFPSRRAWRRSDDISCGHRHMDKYVFDDGVHLRNLAEPT